MQYIITYLSMLVSLCLLDYLRLGVIMQAQIQQWFGHLMRSPIALGPALAFYVLYSVAVIIFAVIPASKTGNIYHALWYGALLGFTAYMTYDLTNRATLNNRPVAMVLPDILWGTVVTAIVAVIGFYVWQRF